MPTKSLPSSNLAPLTEDKMYTVPRAYFWIAVLLTANVVPWIVLLIVLDDGWWAFGPLFGNMYNNYRLLAHKTVKFSINANHTVTHFNAMGSPVCHQNQVPLSKYEKIRFTNDNHRVIFVKTDKYYDDIRAKLGGCCR